MRFKKFFLFSYLPVALSSIGFICTHIIFATTVGTLYICSLSRGSPGARSKSWSSYTRSSLFNCRDTMFWFIQKFSHLCSFECSKTWFQSFFREIFRALCLVLDSNCLETFCPISYLKIICSFYREMSLGLEHCVLRELISFPSSRKPFARIISQMWRDFQNSCKISWMWSNNDGACQTNNL